MFPRQMRLFFPNAFSMKMPFREAIFFLNAHMPGLCSTITIFLISGVFFINNSALTLKFAQPLIIVIIDLAPFNNYCFKSKLDRTQMASQD